MTMSAARDRSRTTLRVTLAAFVVGAWPLGIAGGCIPHTPTPEADEGSYCPQDPHCTPYQVDDAGAPWTTSREIDEVCNASEDELAVHDVMRVISWHEDTVTGCADVSIGAHADFGPRLTGSPGIVVAEASHSCLLPAHTEMIAPIVGGYTFRFVRDQTCDPGWEATMDLVVSFSIRCAGDTGPDAGVDAGAMGAEKRIITIVRVNCCPESGTEPYSTCAWIPFGGDCFDCEYVCYDQE